MAIYKPQVASIQPLKTGRVYILVALAAASLLPTVLKSRIETTSIIRYLWFVNSHEKLYGRLNCFK